MGNKAGSGSTFLMGGGGLQGRGTSQYQSFGEGHAELEPTQDFDNEQSRKNRKTSTLSSLSNRSFLGEAADSFLGGDAATSKRQRVTLFWYAIGASILISVVLRSCSFDFSGSSWVNKRRNLIERSTMRE